MMNHFPTAYLGGTEPEKLSELRAKTDRQILRLLHSRLQLGLNFVALAGEMSSDENTDHAEQLLGRAEQAVIEVKQLLRVLTEDQQRSFGKQLNDLQEALENLGRNCETPRSATVSMS